MAFIFPGAGALGFLWVIALHEIAFGVLLIVAGIRARALAGTDELAHA
jgi:hypothetical protein